MQQVRVLVVDTEKSLYLEAENALHSYSVRLYEFNDEVTFSVVSVPDKASALAALRSTQEPVDLVLLPHAPHTPTTHEMLSEFRKLAPELIIVIIASSPTLQEALHLTRAGAFEFLVRPLPGEDLRATSKKAARQILANRKAMALEEERRTIRFQFLSVLAHELKAPIAAIEGYLELMRDKTLGTDIDAYKDFLDRSLARVDGMRRLILDLLDLTRLESGQMRTSPERIAFQEIVEETLEILTPDAQKRNISIELSIPPETFLVADRQHLLMVCNNLLSNAIKYNHDGGKIRLSCRRERETLLLECSDTGIGMKKEDVERLFGEFVRIKTAETRNIAGSGLGLSILKKIVSSYRGNVAVKSEPGKGTTFSVTLRDIDIPKEK